MYRLLNGTGVLRIVSLLLLSWRPWRSRRFHFQFEEFAARLADQLTLSPEVESRP